jgi:hypothetical protein
MHSPSTNQRFSASPWGFDNIGDVLKKMGRGFEHEKIGWRQIKSLEALHGCDVLFVNCALRFLFGYGRKVAPALRDFVEQGGVLYASDWAVAGVQAATPPRPSRSTSATTTWATSPRATTATALRPVRSKTAPANLWSRTAWSVVGCAASWNVCPQHALRASGLPVVLLETLSTQPHHQRTNHLTSSS